MDIGSSSSQGAGGGQPPRRNIFSKVKQRRTKRKEEKREEALRTQYNKDINRFAGHIGAMDHINNDDNNVLGISETKGDAYMKEAVLNLAHTYVLEKKRRKDQKK